MIPIPSGKRKILAGFHGLPKSWMLFGDYAIITKHFCELAEGFALHPEVKSGSLLVYKLEKYRERKKEFFELSKKILEKNPQIVHQDELIYLFHQYLEKNEYQDGIPLIEDDIDLNNEGNLVNVILEGEKRFLSLGIYNEIPYKNFCTLVNHAVSGGEHDWFEENTPEFAQNAIESIGNSKNPLYINLRRNPTY
ncbi:MAG: hypothetical protein AABW65_01160 [Nanoarchaeota archaeon]